MVRWIVDNELAAASGPRLSVQERVRADVDAWIEDVTEKGVKSIICLLDERELDDLYHDLPGADQGLLAYWRRRIEATILPRTVAIGA